MHTLPPILPQKNQNVVDENIHKGPKKKSPSLLGRIIKKPVADRIGFDLELSNKIILPSLCHKHGTFLGPIKNKDSNFTGKL